MNHAPTGFIVAFATLLIISAISVFRDPRGLSAVSQWWLQIVILGLFVWTLCRARIPSKTLATWFVLSLLPHVVLAFIQYAIQRVDGTSLLGIASQLPENLGVSVVEFGDKRFLRAYGGFPHPNIFGGWLALGLVVSLSIAAWAESKRTALFAALSSAAISVALLLTFSRSAWVAAVIGVVLVGAPLAGALRPIPPADPSAPPADPSAPPADDHIFGRLIRAGARPAPTQFLIVALFASVLAVGIVGYAQRAVVFARADTSSRLEAKSIDVRVKGLQEGWDVFRHHVFIGTGPNAELMDLVPQTNKTAAPLEPPHNAFLLALENVGIIGFAALSYLVWSCLSVLRRRHRSRFALPFLAPLFVLALFDHYLWSTWSGQCLLALVFVLAFASADEHEGGREVEGSEAYVD